VGSGKTAFFGNPLPSGGLDDPIPTTPFRVFCPSFMAFLRAGALWMLTLALALGAVFCLFFGLRSLVEVITGLHDGRTRFSGVLIGFAFLSVAFLLGWGAFSVVNRLF